MKFIENHRALIIAGSLILTFSCGCAVGTVGVQNIIESEVASAAEKQDMGQKGTGEQGDAESSVSSGIDKETLDKNNLDSADYYYKEALDENNLDSADYYYKETLVENFLDSADYYLEKMPEAPLLKENADPETADYAGSSLEVDVNDINATNKAGDIIRKLCKENGIDVNKAKVKDLTREQIAWIDMETFNQSEHGK